MGGLGGRVGVGRLGLGGWGWEVGFGGGFHARLTPKSGGVTRPSTESDTETTPQKKGKKVPSAVSC